MGEDDRVDGRAWPLGDRVDDGEPLGGREDDRVGWQSGHYVVERMI